MPVPPPTFPSATGPCPASASAACTCSGRTWKPLMSLSAPSYVSPTVGSAQMPSLIAWARAAASMSASRTTPTLWVFVMPIAPASIPASRIHSRPVSSPLPLSRCAPAKTGSVQMSRVMRQHHRHAGADRSLAGPQWPIAGDQRGVADPHASDVRDGVEVAGLHPTDADAEISRAHRRSVAVGSDRRSGVGGRWCRSGTLATMLDEPQPEQDDPAADDRQRPEPFAKEPH